MNRLGLTAKLTFGFGLTLTMLVLLGVVAFLSLANITAATERCQ